MARLLVGVELGSWPRSFPRILDRRFLDRGQLLGQGEEGSGGAGRHGASRHRGGVGERLPGPARGFVTE
jgi:hypothetical protein